jgi:hypothetical protein
LRGQEEDLESASFLTSNEEDSEGSDAFADNEGMFALGSSSSHTERPFSDQSNTGDAHPHHQVSRLTQEEPPASVELVDTNWFALHEKLFRKGRKS